MEQDLSGTVRVEAPVSSAVYERLCHAAQKAGMPVEDAVRRAIIEWTYRVAPELDPFDRLIGKIDGPADTASNVDDIYDGM